MRHQKSGRKLKRTASHRKALMGNLSTSLILHKRITTTLAKAKETRSQIEPMITRARRAFRQKETTAAGVHERRIVGRVIRDREALKELFSTVAERVGERNGGYTRIVKLGQRPGDGAELAVIELVDFNTGQETKEKASPAAEKKKAARTPKGKSGEGSKKKEKSEKKKAAGATAPVE